MTGRLAAQAGRRRPGGWCNRLWRTLAANSAAVKPCGAGARATAAARAARIRGLFRSMPAVRAAPAADGSGSSSRMASGMKAASAQSRAVANRSGDPGKEGDDLAEVVQAAVGARAEGPADQACGMRWPVEESFELGRGARLGSVPGTPLRRDPPPPRPRHVRPRDLRRHHRDAQGPHRHPGWPVSQARRCPARQPRPDPTHRPRGPKAPWRCAYPAETTRPRSPLAPMATPPAGTIPLASPTRTPGT